MRHVVRFGTLSLVFLLLGSYNGFAAAPSIRQGAQATQIAENKRLSSSELGSANAVGEGPEGPAPVVADGNDITNSIGMRLRLLPAGEFRMGSNQGEENERPPHTVSITKSFFMAVHEVTQEQWKKVMGYNPSHFKDPNRPVENVSWHDATAFCQKLSGVEGAQYRLPTEAEWEYACRAGTTTEHYWGNEPGGEYAWSIENSRGESHPVGRKKPNAWGLYDMGGNVYEWCADTFGPFPAGPVVDPKVVSNSSFHVDRGGCWYNKLEYCRSTDRGGRLADFRDFFVGFRVVRDQ